MARATAGLSRTRTNLSWWIGLLLGFGILINYFDRVNLSVAHPALTKEFCIDDVACGLVLSWFAWTYAILQIPIGVVRDRYGVIGIGRIGAFFCSIACFMTAAAQLFWH